MYHHMVALYCLSKKRLAIVDVHRILCTKCQYIVRFFPLPCIVNLLDRVGKAKYFSIDLATAYH